MARAPWYSPEQLLERLVSGNGLGAIAQDFPTTKYVQIESDARQLGWTFDDGGRPHRIADDTPDGAEQAQLDDRPSDANGDPGTGIVFDRLAGLTLHDENLGPRVLDPLTGAQLYAAQLAGRPGYVREPAQAAEPALLDTGEGRLIEVVTVPLADEVPDYRPELVPVTLATRPLPDPAPAVDRRADPVDLDALPWMLDLDLTPIALVALLEVARSNDRGAIRAIASAILSDLADLVQLLDPTL